MFSVGGKSLLRNGRLSSFPGLSAQAGANSNSNHKKGAPSFGRQLEPARVKEGSADTSLLVNGGLKHAVGACVHGQICG